MRPLAAPVIVSLVTVKTTVTSSAFKENNWTIIFESHNVLSAAYRAARAGRGIYIHAAIILLC